MKRLAIITTHPIQYNAPVFELLSQRQNIDIRVFYTWGEDVLQKKYDPGFEKIVSWDIPLLQGYNYEFVKNTSNEKGSHHFNGIINPSIISSVENYKPDAVLVFGWAFNSHLKVLRYFKNKIPVLFRGDSTLLDERRFLPSLIRNLFLRWIYRHVDVALYVGKNNFDYYRKVGLTEKQLFFAPHAIDNERFECSSVECKNNALTFKDKLQILPTDFVYLFAGKMEDKKDPGILLEAFNSLKFDTDVHLLMVGNGELEKEMRLSYEKNKNIHFLDFQNQLQMPAIYQSADVFILPSKGPGETWGLSINEAMANGKAIIASDKCGGAVNLVEDGVNGYIFEAGNLIDLQDRMRLLYEQRGGLKKMKTNSLKKIKHFSLEKLAASIEMVVEKVAHKNIL